jgi:hypothetical protein
VDLAQGFDHLHLNDDRANFDDRINDRPRKRIVDALAALPPIPCHLPDPQSLSIAEIPRRRPDRNDIATAGLCGAKFLVNLGLRGETDAAPFSPMAAVGSMGGDQE